MRYRAAGAAAAWGVALAWIAGSGVLLYRRNIALHAARAQVAANKSADANLRHDLRGILSPALMAADPLLGHAEPRVRRAGEIVVRMVERAAARLK